MKATTIILLFVVSVAILVFIYVMIYINRENQNTYGLAVKVFAPLLLSVTLLMWDMFSNEIKEKKSFVSIGIFDKNDGFPISLGGIYFNVFNDGICYSANTTAYRATDFKDRLTEIWERNHPYEPDTITNGVQVYKKSKNNPLKKIELGELSIELVGIGLMHNFLKRLYRMEWEIESKKYRYLGGGGMGTTRTNQNDSKENSTYFRIDDVLPELELSFTDEIKESGFKIPKTGKYAVISKREKRQFGSIEIVYSSDYIKEYSIKIGLFQHGKLTHGKFVEALREHVDLEDMYAYYYAFDLNLDTYWYNKWSPQAKREINWINKQMELLEEYYSFDKIENDLIYALKNSNSETTNITLKGR